MRKSTVYIGRARGRRLGAKSNRYARTQKSSNSLIRFCCSNSSFLLETGIAGHERLFLAKWHPKAEKKLRKRRFFNTADRHEKSYGRSWLYASAQGRHETGSVLSLFSSLSFDISIKNSVQRWSSDFQGLFCVKTRKMAQGSNDLSTLPLTRKAWKTTAFTHCYFSFPLGPLQSHKFSSGTYFCTFILLDKVPNLILYENFFFFWGPWISTLMFWGTQKYEN